MIRIFCIYLIAIFSIWNIANIAAWSYKHQDMWSSISRVCGDGRKQSPIDVQFASLVKDPAHVPISFKNYNEIPKKMTLVNKGYTVQIDAEWESADKTPTISGGRLKGEYVFVQAHLHWSTDDTTGSEHAIQGERYAAEFNFVHRKKDTAFSRALLSRDGFVVIAHLLKKNNTLGKNVPTALTPLEKALPLVTNIGSKTLLEKMSIHDLKPEFGKIYMSYDKGSLTIPPCAESVTYIIPPYTMPITEMQLKLLRNITLNFGDKTNVRDLQKLNKRKVTFNNPYP